MKRTKNTIKNMSISIITQVVTILLGFISRKVFLDALGTEYLGINGLLTNILSMLSLVDGGIGLSIVYSLYKPLAEDDRPTIISLVNLYKKVYSVIAIVIFILSIILYFFLGSFIKDGTSVKYIGFIYCIFVVKNIISYLNAHKWSLINADQKGYIIAKYTLLFNIISTIGRILVLLLTQNYILYLLIELVVFSVETIFNGKVVERRYSYILKSKEKYVIDKNIKDELIKNVKAIFLHNIGSYCVFGTDNILISSLINLKTVGLYSNYLMVTDRLHKLLEQVLSSIGASVGNLIATEGKEKIKSIFDISYFINFWMYSVSVIFLYNLLEPFINWWLGKGLLLDKLSFIFILVNFYITGMRISVETFKSKAGIFSEDKYVPLLESVINLVSSILFAKYLGLSGIFIGTTISTVSLPLWIQPKLVYNKVFEESNLNYFKKYLSYVVLTILCGSISSFICNVIISSYSFISLIIRGLISIIVPSLIYILIFFKKKEFKYILNLLKKEKSI